MIWDKNLDKLQKKEKIDAICRDLLEKLDNTKEWNKSGHYGVIHKTYNLEVFINFIHRPQSVNIPLRWRRRIKQKIKKIFYCYEMETLTFLHDVIQDKYPLHVHIRSEEEREWLKENAKEDDYIQIDYWYYIKNESLAVAYKLRWL